MTPWIVLAFLIGFACRAALHRSYLERQNRMHRRIGWGYGYGAGWVDGANGVPPRHKAPRDGRLRDESAPNNRAPSEGGNAEAIGRGSDDA